MKAIVCTRYGPPEVLELRDVEKPAPRNDEVLIKVHATAVTSGDCRMRSSNLRGVPAPMRILARLKLGLTRPRRPIPGLCLAGEVEAAGKDVRRFEEGDQVYAETVTGMRFGAHAEYTCLPEDGFMGLKPPGVSYEEAVAVPFGGLSALYFLRRAGIRRGQKVLVHGASGAVGTAAVQLARYFGAEVTGVCGTANSELVRSLGADTVIDYTKEDFTKSGHLFDVIFDAVGKASYSRSKSALGPNGKYVSIVRHARRRSEDLPFLYGLVEAGKMKPVIDRRYTLEQMVEAHRYVDGGHKKGNVVITVADDDGAHAVAPRIRKGCS